jgi:protein SDA1
MHKSLLFDFSLQANHKGTSASKKKKKAKLERVVRSLKRQQRKSTEETGSNYYSPLTYLKDPQVE